MVEIRMGGEQFDYSVKQLWIKKTVPSSTVPAHHRTGYKSGGAQLGTRVRQTV